ncbi:MULTISPECIES: flagellar hook-basal body complex protein [Vagococcus]|uniref:Flagellar basal-body rod protein FlgF n=1 Tax=Vagococcus fluvialis bH819 TaxID=1255619 RepID=A0A1X6WRJ5_9ENTE|nr:MULTISPECIES: flagellar hook-basal body complex protein [Vagococcus]SLM86895.1 Flagellar basal-body rod protein FlgF [Vagococcus fluvialis bH819]HCM88648.1 flagellar hook-basal body complex protein [Vagococcus sp.]
MIRSMYTLQRNLSVLQTKQENTSSNVANVNTYGYKSQQTIQKTDEEQNLHNFTGGPGLNKRKELGSFVFGNKVDEIFKDMSSGSFKQTNKQSDFAVLGEGYFNVQLPNGQTGYTKNGHFQVNQQNQLITQDGNIVLSQNRAPIDVRNDQPNFQLTKFNDQADLVAQGESLFTAENPGIEDRTSQVRSSMLEGSNVNMVNEMTTLMDTARQFEINQKALHTSDETLRKLTNEIGRA